MKLFNKTFVPFLFVGLLGCSYNGTKKHEVFLENRRFSINGDFDTETKGIDLTVPLNDRYPHFCGPMWVIANKDTALNYGFVKKEGLLHAIFLETELPGDTLSVKINGKDIKSDYSSKELVILFDQKYVGMFKKEFQRIFVFDASLERFQTDCLGQILCHSFLGEIDNELLHRRIDSLKKHGDSLGHVPRTTP